MSRKPRKHAQLRYAGDTARLSIVAANGKTEFSATYPCSVSPRRVRRMLQAEGWNVGFWRRNLRERMFREYTATARPADPTDETSERPPEVTA